MLLLRLNAENFKVDTNRERIPTAPSLFLSLFFKVDTYRERGFLMSYRVGLVSLGCAKNLVDSEVMLGQLDRAGFVLTNQEKEADILIVNTCAFILPAVRESLQNIFELARLKKNGRCRLLLVAGCLAQRYGKRLLAELPEVDGFIGPGSVPAVAEVVKKALAGERVYAVGKPVYQQHPDLPRLLTTPAHTAYVKIAEGCSNRCTFCTIPFIRGPYRSRPLEHIEKEVRFLVARGVREIILIAQDTALYGYDCAGASRLPELLRRLDDLPDLRWLRLMYCSPDHFTGELLTALAESKKCCRYLDIPVQHASDEILKKMNRRKKRAEIQELLGQLRAAIPGLVLRTTFLVGFPGETEAHFAELLDFMSEMSFERAGVFRFYPEEGTRAAALPGQVPEEIKAERYHRAMARQQEISLRYNQTKVGQKLLVLVEGKTGARYFGRTEGDAPEIDGKVYFTAGKKLSPGEFVSVFIKEAKEYDLIGEWTGESA